MEKAFHTVSAWKLLFLRFSSIPKIQDIVYYIIIIVAEFYLHGFRDISI